MIDCEQLFPFDRIEKNSRIIIYGMGNFGRSYLGQVLSLGYCHVLYVSDKSRKEDACGIPYISPDKIKNIDCDKVVVAIYTEAFAKEAMEELVAQGVPKERLIVPFANSNKQITFVEESPEKASIEDLEYITVGLILEGGLGDYVVFEALYEKIKSYGQNIKIYIYARNLSYIDAVFFGKEIEEKWSVDDAYNKQLDLILHCRNSINVDRFNQKKIKEKSPKLYESVLGIDSRNGDYEMGSIGRNKDSVLLERAKFQRKNRFQFLAGDIFNLNASDVFLQLDDNYRAAFDKYGLKQYISFNCWSDTLKEEKSQIKVWPKAYFEEFITIFRNKYPELKIVQVGAKECPHINGADTYILGENLRLVEHVLYNSLLHIDCEGGLVHIATALGTKCAVLFGPTPLHFYAYEQNINISSGDCNGCMGLIENWPFECIRGLDKPECMYNITPELLMDEITKRNILNG